VVVVVVVVVVVQGEGGGALPLEKPANGGVCNDNVSKAKMHADSVRAQIEK